MANEVFVHREGSHRDIVRQFTVADGTAISKGSLLVYGAATRTGLKHGGANQTPLGYTVEDKEASDGKTEIGCQRTGVVYAVIDGTVLTGDNVVPGTTANRLRAITQTINALSYVELQNIVGRALESGTDGQRIKVALTLG